MVYILAKNLIYSPHPLFPSRLIFPENSVVFRQNHAINEKIWVEIGKIKVLRGEIGKVCVVWGKIRGKFFN